MSQLPFCFQLIILFIFGCCIGSFLQVCAERWGQEKSIIFPGSHCPHCETKIPWYFNIPIISWLYLKGKSACCHRPIPIRYFLAECILGLVSAGFYAYFKTLYVPYFTLFCLLWIAFFTDIDAMIIPDEVTLLGIVLGVLMSYFWEDLQGYSGWKGCSYSLQAACLSIGGLFLFMSIVEFIIKKEAMGLGDVKLIGCLGAFLGSQACLTILFSGAIFGTGIIFIYTIFIRCIRKKTIDLSNKRIPFGPFLVISTIFYLFFPKMLKAIFLPVF